MVQTANHTNGLSYRRSVDDLLEAAVLFSHGQLILNDGDYVQLIGLLEKQALRLLDPGDKIRLDGVTLHRNLDGAAVVVVNSR